MKQYYRITEDATSIGIEVGLNSNNIYDIINSYHTYINNQLDEYSTYSYKDIICIMYSDGYVIEYSNNIYNDIYIDNEDSVIMGLLDVLNMIDIR